MAVNEDRRDDGEAAERPRDGGVLRVTTSTLKIPEGLETSTSTRGTDRVVLVVLGLCVLFIVVIAWLIHGGQ